MDWNDLRHVLAVHRHRTLTGAGTELRVTHTTVGRRLRGCEDAMGVRLFDRTPDGLHATAAGLELVEIAERFEEEVMGATSRIMGRDAELRGSLRVSIFDHLMWGHAEAFASFSLRYPSVELTLTATLDQVSLTRREADVAVRLSEGPPDTLIGRKVGVVEFAVYASDALVDRIGVDAPYSDYPWIGWDQRLDGRWFDDWLAEHAPGASIAARIDESAILRRQVVCAGIGAFFLSRFEGDAIPGIQRLGPRQFSRPLWLLTLPDLRHTSRVRAFMDHMASAMARPSP